MFTWFKTIFATIFGQPGVQRYLKDHTLFDVKGMVDIVSNLIPLQPLINAAAPKWGSFPIAVLLEPMGVPFLFDPWYMQSKKIINSRSLVIMGDLIAGKTTAAIAICIQLAARMNSYGKRARVLMVARKRTGQDETSKAEYQQFVEDALGGSVVDMQANNFNYHEPRLQLSHQALLQILVLTVTEQNNGTSPTQTQEASLNLALEIQATKDPSERSHDGLTKILQETSLGQACDYLNIAYNPEQPSRLAQEIVDAAGYMAMTLTNFKKKYGVFCGEDSLVDALDSPAVLIDFTLQAFELQSFSHLLLLTIQSLSTAPMLEFDIIVSDESYEDWESLPKTNIIRRDLKKNREKTTFRIFVMHALRDLESVGAEGAENRAKAIAAIKDVAMFMIGVMKLESDRLALQELLRFSDYVRDQFEVQTQGQFHFILRDAAYAPVPIQFVLGAIEKAISKTEGATDAMTRRDAA